MTEIAAHRRRHDLRHPGNHACLVLTVAKLFEPITRLERQIAVLREYRTRLVADAVTGQLDVHPAAPHLPVEPIEPAPTCDDLDADQLAPEPSETEA